MLEDPQMKIDHSNVLLREEFLEFNSWGRDAVLESSVEQTTIKVSLEGVILPRFYSLSSGSKCHTEVGFSPVIVNHS
jgi:hypothetical protein